MNKISGVARRILGWKLNRWDRWYDFEKRKFIPDTDFQPEENINHAMLIVDRLEQCGYTYTIKSPTEVHFNDITGTGRTLAQAITDAAFNLVERHSGQDNTENWRTLC